MQLKRILAIFLAAALIFSAFTVSVGAEPLEILEVGVAAETTTPVSSSPVIYNTNEEVTVTISADQNTGFDFLWLKVSYDPAALEYVDYTTNTLFGNETFMVKDGYVLFTAILNSVSTATGDMFTLNFKTKADFCGETEIVAQLSGNDEANCKNGSASVPFVGGTAGFVIHDIDTTTGVVTAPTCIDKGYTTYACANCEAAVVGNFVDANGHTEAAAVEENRVEADCENNGSYDMVVYCDVCGVELSRESFVIDALGHTPLEAVEENRVEADCENNGSYDMVVYCDVCDKELSRESFVIDAHGHTPLEAVEENRIEPDCTNKGSYDMVVYCDICDAEISRENFEIDALGHDLVPHDSKAPTCTEIGWKAYNTCARCDYTTYVELPALGHDLVAHDAKAPTCTEIGWDAYDTCSRCDYTTYVEKAALGHTPLAAVEENRVEPDCTNKGSYDSVVYCDACKAEISREKVAIDALGHDLITHDSKTPNYKEIGWDAYNTCSRCDYTTYVELDILKIKEIAVTKAPDKLTYIETLEVLDVTGGQITIHYENNTNEVIDITSDMVSGFDNTVVGKQNITITVVDKTAKFEVEIIKLLNGWTFEDGKWAYYENNVMLKDCWKEDGTGWCYLGSDGYCVTNTWMFDRVAWCYLNAEGRMVTNSWVMDSVGWCYVGADGYCVTNAWKRDSYGWCYLDEEGRMATNRWVMDSVGWCYVGADGYAVTNTWKQDSYGWCYLDSEGRMVQSNWVLDGDSWYYLDENGYMVTGWYPVGGTWYNFASNGVWLG